MALRKIAALIAGLGIACTSSVLRAEADAEQGQEYQSASDFDDDGVADGEDNCPFAFNPTGSDLDADGIGDACDNCPNRENGTSSESIPQVDVDSDGLGDVCDEDADGDFVIDAVDLCPDVYNPDQSDLDSDGEGDACDGDIDGDSRINLNDPCPLARGTAVGPDCNRDGDADGVEDFVLGEKTAVGDNCATMANADQADQDEDGLGDICDPDRDGDGVANEMDNCPDAVNGYDGDGQGQVDGDRDGLGDACDELSCYVVFGDEAGCLCLEEERDCVFGEGDDEVVRSHGFSVYVPPIEQLLTGEWVQLRMFSNRVDAEIAYEWTVTRSPAYSKSTVENPVGSTRSSGGFFEYDFGAAVPRFRAKNSGRYEITATATQVSADALTGEKGLVSTASTVVYVSGASLDDAGACSCQTVGAAPVVGHVLRLVFFAILALLGLLLGRRY